MPARKVDIVFCLDTSDSMQPCLDAIRAKIGEMIDQLSNAKFEWRIDFVAQCLPARNVYRTLSVEGSTCDLLYRNGASGTLFTKDLGQFKQALSELTVAGDEDMLCALDFALDFPFGPANETQRVVILISDEPFETNEESAFAKSRKKIHGLMEKIRARHVTFFAVMPIREHGVAEELSMVDRADIIQVEENDLGLVTTDMSDILRQLGKTISTMTVQGSGEDSYTRALFGQDRWGNAGVDYLFNLINDKK